MKSKKAQLMLWVVIAVVVVVVIIIYFFVIKKSADPVSQRDYNINNYISKCVSDNIEDATDIMIPQSGFLEPINYKEYKGTKIEYLCKNIGNFKPCINHHPAYISEINKQLEEYLSPRVEECFANLKSELESEGNKLDIGEQSLNISIGEDQINVKLSRKITLTDKSQTKVYENFDIDILNPIYNLAYVAQEIANQEAKYCYFEYVGYMILYPRFEISKFQFSDQTYIYTIKDRNTNKIMNIAIKSCSVPAGI